MLAENDGGGCVADPTDSPGASAGHYNLIAAALAFAGNQTRIGTGRQIRQSTHIWLGDGCRSCAFEAKPPGVTRQSGYRAGHGMIGTVLTAFAGEPLTIFVLIAR